MVGTVRVGGDDQHPEAVARDGWRDHAIIWA
jgi:hypothetical protein